MFSKAQSQKNVSTGLRHCRLGKTVMWTFLILAFLLSAGTLCAQTEDEVREKLEEAGEEGLLMFFDPGEIMVTSSARRPQPLYRASSAMYVITKEDIRQSGVTKIADLLRFVPGMDVSQRRPYEFAIGSRGFSKWSASRLQILLDGRPLYDSFQAGVNIDFHPIFLENIERIEIMRSPGGVVWGVNALNGVINIITKKAADTQGGLGYGGFGSHATQEGFIRYGGTEGPLSWRGTTGAFHDNGFGLNRGNDNTDYVQSFQSTGLGEVKLNDGSILSLSGGHKFFSYGTGSSGSKHRSMQYTNLIWDKELDEDNSIQMRWSETYFKRDNLTQNIWTREDMLEFKHIAQRGIHNIVWGADYTRDAVRTRTTTTDILSPDRFRNDQASAYIQDEIALRDDLWLTLGYRGHHNELSHYDWAGNVALVHEIVPKHFLKAAVSRSFKRPSFLEEFADKSNERGNQNLRNEKLLAYEIGYRGQLRDNLELNVEGFINEHEDLIAKVSSLSNRYYNVHDITTYGLETAIDWRPKDWWLVRGFHVYEHQTEENKINVTATGKLGMNPVPQNKVGLTNRFYLDDKTTLNTRMFWTDTYGDSSGNRIPRFLRVDFRLAKKIWDDNAEIALGVNNLTNGNHYEGGTLGAEVPRIVYAQFFLKF
ncbi:MAG: TonB-dependent receptor plug domain-containing protein [Planctomycetes bacterium]|nr:TonB-dependent receptor plug domain-containing protein [Planctomycetota bacterium]